MIPSVHAPPVQLTIVLPALNEEQAIGQTIERCQAAAHEICLRTGVTRVRIVVVSDGSTDRTAAIARTFTGVDVLEFPENQGYGAAIKAGWNHGGGELLGFLDADGTCDPMHFIPMCREILENHQDVVLGCRMTAGSGMPAFRRLGNKLFVLLLGFLSRKRVRDTASGMRVVRRQALPALLPLPDGLHFTPAMSARALLDDDIKIKEIDMEYRERIGRSKLHALRDGLRFLNVILSATAYIKVSRLTVPLMAIVAAASAAVVAGPALFYLRNRRLEEWMFYRVSLAGMLVTIAVSILCATVIAEHTIALTLHRYGRFRQATRGLWRYETLRLLVLVGCALWVVGAALNIEGVVDLLTRGQVELHWSRVMLGAFLTIHIAQLVGTLCVLKIIRALHQRQPFLHPGTPAAPGDE